MKEKNNFIIFIYIIFILFSLITIVSAEGVTILIHGWQVTSSEPAWTGAMQTAIGDSRLNGEHNFGTITVSGTKGALTTTCSPWNVGLASSSTGEIVIKVDWSPVANHLISGVTAQEVAAVLAPKIYQGQNGERALSELPIHLLGHSRGGGMICELARLLGEQGIEVDQVSPFDPHPLTASDPQPIFPLPAVIDTPITIYENILFIDNYWQNITYPQGQSISGAYNRLWTSIPGGYHNHSNSAFQAVADHCNIELMYLGTVNLSTPVNDGEAALGSTERSAWYNTYETDGGTPGQKAGFYYSRIAGQSDRKSVDKPQGTGDRIIDGYNNNITLGGAGVRSTLTWTSAVWPNIITIDVFRSSTKLGPGNVDISNNETLDIQYTYRKYTGSSTVTLYADIDRNPYNNNNVATIGSNSHTATGSNISQSSKSWNVSGLTVGSTYYVYAKIEDGTRTRYLYASPSFKAALTSSTNYTWTLY